MTDSSTGGYLLPLDSAPLADTALVVALQGVVVGITGLPGALVRPAWQPIPPKQPEYNVDWAAIGVTTVDSDTNDMQIYNDAVLSNLPAAVGVLPVGVGAVGSSAIGTSLELNGYLQAIENERLRVVVSFYGPNSTGYARQLRAGIKLGQNREALYAIQTGLMSIGNIVWLPELVNNEWIARADLDFILSRAITRVYAVDAIVSAEGVIITNASAGGVTVQSPFDTSTLGRG